jgi:hypothetical protein
VTAVGAPTGAGVLPLIAALAARVGVSDGELIGRPVGVALRYAEQADGLFLSGVPRDLVDLVAAAFPVEVAVTGDANGDANGDDVEVAEEAWSRGAAEVVGTGPVLARADGTWASTPSRRLTLVGRPTAVASKHAEVAALREALLRTSERLQSDLETPPEWARIVQVADRPGAVIGQVLADVGTTRTLVGRYLLDAADYFDDERIDQLGDGYVRVAQAWQQAAQQPDYAIGRDILALEEACAGWMRRAAEPPTRYAF